MTQYTVVAVFEPTPRNEAWGMPPGSFGCGRLIGYQVQGFTKSFRARRYASWIYATQEEAAREAARLRRLQKPREVKPRAVKPSKKRAGGI